jgi:hypothetical protein
VILVGFKVNREARNSPRHPVRYWFKPSGVRHAWTRNPEYAQKTFDLISSTEKELLWIEKHHTTLQRWLQSLRKASGKNYRVL